MTGLAPAETDGDILGGGHPSSSSSWFEEDDEALLSRLLQPRGYDDEYDDLDARLDRLRARLTRDVRRAVVADGWWDGVVRAASESGFAFPPFPPSAAAAAAPDDDDEPALPRAFDSPGGKAHVRALVDLLDIGEGRVVRLTLASLRSFASAGTTTASPAVDDDDDDDDDRESLRLRSLLGTVELFRRVLLRHRAQFLARLGVVTECLRLEQEERAEDDDYDRDDGKGLVPRKRKDVGRSCARFLDALDSSLLVPNDDRGMGTTATTTAARKRGLLRLLLRLSCGPSLPGMGASEYPRSVDDLRGGGGDIVVVVGVVSGGFGAGPIAGGDDECHLAVRAVAAEALSVLLYDRVDGGATRRDLFPSRARGVVLRIVRIRREGAFAPVPTVDYSRERPPHGRGGERAVVVPLKRVGSGPDEVPSRRTMGADLRGVREIVEDGRWRRWRGRRRRLDDDPSPLFGAGRARRRGSTSEGRTRGSLSRAALVGGKSARSTRGGLRRPRSRRQRGRRTVGSTSAGGHRTPLSWPAAPPRRPRATRRRIFDQARRMG